MTPHPQRGRHALRSLCVRSKVAPYALDRPIRAPGVRMKRSADRPEHLFIVRLWSEVEASKPPLWRGSVQHIGSGQHFFFSNVRDLWSFVDAELQRPKGDESVPRGG